MSASLEDYLETIFALVREKQAARARDIGKRLKVGRSSVTGALHALAKRGLINYAPYDVITLTEQGLAVAEDVTRRHEVVRDFFVKVLGVTASEADDAACKVEHAIGENILERFVEFAEFVDRCPRAGTIWTRSSGGYCKRDQDADDCEKCVGAVMEEVRGRREKICAGPKVTSLTSLEPGVKGQIAQIEGKKELRGRLLAMGATSGTVVEVVRNAPMGGPIEVKIRGYRLSLRKEDAQGIGVTLLPSADEQTR